MFVMQFVLRYFVLVKTGYPQCTLCYRMCKVNNFFNFIKIL